MISTPFKLAYISLSKNGDENMKQLKYVHGNSSHILLAFISNPDALLHCYNIIGDIVTQQRLVGYGFFFMPPHSLHAFGGFGHLAAVRSFQVTWITPARLENYASRVPAFGSGSIVIFFK